MLAHESPMPHVTALESILHRIEVNEGPVKGAQHNPCVFTHAGELHAVVRVLHGRKTTNYVGKLSSEWTLPTARRIVFGDVPPREIPTEVEDLRVFSWQGRLWAICAAHDGNNPPRAIRQGILELSDDGAEIRRIHVQPSPRHEKNWMPAVLGDRLKLVYSLDPLVTMDVQAVQSGGYHAMPGAPSIAQTTGHLRGGSQLVYWGPGQWIAIVHQVHKPRRIPSNYNHLLSSFWPPVVKDPVAGDEKVVYLHRFAIFNADLGLVQFSEPFYFKHVGIEFCSGLALHEERLIASFGVADKEAWLAEIAHATVRRMMGETP
jgi:hypothetical protein